MSWKSFVTAGLLCALASPAFAAPSIEVIKGGTFANGHLDANGDWVWLVRISQSSPPVDIDNMGGAGLPLGSPLAAELGFRELLSELVAANRTGLESGWSSSGAAHDNPGNGIFGWEVLSNTDGDTNGPDGTGTCGAPPCKFGEVGADTGDEPVGIQTNTTLDEVFSALGSVDYLSDVNGKEYIRIVVAGPRTPAGGGTLSSQLQMLGAFGGGGRISELNDGFNPAQQPSDTNLYSHNCQQDPTLGSCDVNTAYQGTFTRTAQAGDADLQGGVTLDDLFSVLDNFNSGTTWMDGNFHGNGTGGGGTTNLDDLFSVLDNFNAPSGPGTGPGGGGGAPVPEPATMALVMLGILNVAGLASRRRRG